MDAIPDDYVVYFSSGGPKEGLLKIEPGWFRLWGPEDIERRNRDYAVPERASSFVAFGSSGGCELFAFDKRHRVFILPIVGMSNRAAALLIETWAEFVRLIKASNPSSDQAKKRSRW